MSSFAISPASRKPPSLTTPATPRTAETRDQDRASGRRARVPAAVHDEYGTGRALFDGNALRVITVAEHRDWVPVLSSGHVAQRECFADHGFSNVRVDSMHVLDKLVAQA